MIAKHLTQVIFWGALLLSLISMALVFSAGDFFLLLLVLSILFNLWSIWKNDREGFIKSSQFRRAYEPARHFNIAQVFTVLALVMIQMSLGAYAILT